MQKSGIKFLNVLPQTSVPLDSAFVNLVYTAHFSAFDGFLQVFMFSVVSVSIHLSF